MTPWACRGGKSEYLRAVADAALDGLLDGAALRALDPDQAVQAVRQVKGLGPFAGLDDEIRERYGPVRTLADVSRAWAAVHLRALREQRTSEITGH
jgi:DNA-3-methyladenine glycosylase II